MARRDLFDVTNPHNVQLLNEMLRELYERLAQLEAIAEQLEGE